jgi:chemotaxis protein methyltransferase CheR
MQAIDDRRPPAAAGRMALNIANIHLDKKHFSQIVGVVYRLCGIHLPQGKEELVKVRLTKRLRALGIDSFDEYLTLVQRDQEELAVMIDALTTNKTSFFRESQHFDYLREHLLPELHATQRRIRIWCAGCSSGEEPYTLAIILREEIPNLDREDVRILATDLSTRMVARAREAVYDEETLRDVPPLLMKKYFTAERSNNTTRYRAHHSLRALVKIAQLNLMDSWPMKGKFDAIFCRNVMIYFDKQTQERLVQRFWEFLKPQGFLFVGHSESLTGMSHEFQYVKPAIYMK